jgi:hypothetical protein
MIDLKGKFLAFIDLFESLGKEVLAFTCLTTGLCLLLKGVLTGQQFVDLVKSVAVSYIAGATVGGTADAVLAHLKRDL